MNGDTPEQLPLEYQQIVALALAKLLAERPGWEDMINRTTRKLHLESLVEEFKCVVDVDARADRRLLKAALHGFRSYQYGNASQDLAKEMADKIAEALHGGPPPAMAAVAVEPQTRLSVPHDDYPISQEDLKAAEAIRDEFMGTVEMPPIPPAALDFVNELEKQAQAISGFTGMQGDIAPQKQEQLDLLKTIDAEKWAAEWCRIAKINGERNILEEWVTPVDEGWMITWFANAIETGKTFGARESFRNPLATWMIINSFTTGHGDTTADLLNELSRQVRELRSKALEAGD